MLEFLDNTLSTKLIQKYNEYIDTINSIVIMGHDQPDGDAIGSALSVYNFFKMLGKDAEVVMRDIEPRLSFLPGIQNVKESFSKKEYDLAVVVDCVKSERLGDREYILNNAKYILNIDHHIGNTNFGNINIVNEYEASASQVIFKILNLFEKEKQNLKYLENLEILNDDILICILTAAITDTGGFRYKVVNELTFYIAQYCMQRGIPVYDIIEKSIIDKTLNVFKLEKIILNTLELHQNNKIASMHLLKEDRKDIPEESGDTTGIVNIPKDIDIVQISIFIQEVDNGFRVSLRSKKNLNVQKIAFEFNGGGHLNAAGFVYKCSLDNQEIIKQNLNKLKIELISKCKDLLNEE